MMRVERRGVAPGLAEYLRWPDGALDACVRVERECPGWDVWWDDTGDGPYCAAPEGHPEVGTLHAADPFTLCGLINHVEVGTP